MFGSISNWEGDLFDQFNRLQRELEDALGHPGGPASIRAVARGSYPAINVGATPEGMEVYVFAAGLDQDKLELSVQQNLLTIGGERAPLHTENSRSYLKERFSGQFGRSISLPDDIDPDSASASYRNGVLHISFRRKAEAKPRKVQIN
jgi:HSP20 family protein